MRKAVFRILTLIIAVNAAGILYAQTGSRVNEVIAARFREYCSLVPREEVWIHTDRDCYISGEPVWLAAYLFDRESDNLPTGNSTIYIELINSSIMPVIQKKISLLNGTGNGSFILPDTLSTGRYLLRAYTNWMKNFLPVNCFTKEVDIYNPVSNRILKGIAGTGAEVKPVNNTGSSAGKTFSFSLVRKPDTLVISIASDESFRLGNGSTCYLFIQTHGKINFNEPVRLYGASARVTIPAQQLSEGINHITLFSAAGEPICERLIYTPSEETPRVLADVPSKTGKRSKFSIGIDPGNTSIAGMSISVAAADGHADRSGLVDYMVFGSEFGQLPASLCGRSLKTVPESAIDDFLLSAKSNWIDWTKILSGSIPDLRYRRENEYQNLSGLLVNRETMKPDSGQYVLLSKPGKTAWFQYSETDGNGRFSFDIPAALAGSDIIIQPSDNNRDDVIRIDSQYPSIYFPVNKENKDQPVAKPGFINAWSVNYQVSRIYGIAQVGDSIKQAVSEESLPRFYGKPDLSLIMDNYIKLPVMQEVFFELIPGVYLKSRKSVWELTVADPVDFSIYSSPPMLMIDGVVIHDASLIANLDPELVERIEVVRDRYMIGYYIMYGLVNVITRVGKFSCVDLSDQAIRIAWRNGGAGYSFPEPVLKDDEKTRHIPDLRNTLYWNPSLKADKNKKYNIELRSSDFASQYIISIQGITNNGKSFSIEKVINIGK